MAKLFLVPIDLNQNEVRQGVFHKLASDPAGPVEGQFWYLPNHPKMLLAGNVVFDFTDSYTLNGQLPAYYRSRANHTGTQLANTISDFDTQVRTSRLDQMAAPTSSVNLNGQKIVGLANGVAASDAVNKGQLDAAIQGFSWKDAVRVASTANVNIGSAPNIMDGVNLVAGDRALLKNQTIPAENGLYLFNGTGSTMVRVSDANTGPELEDATVFVDEGATNAGTAWNQTADAVVLGTTGLTFVQFGAGSSYSFTAPLSLAGNTVSLNLSPRMVNNASNQLDLATIVAANTYDAVTVDIYGRVTAGANPTKVNKYSALLPGGGPTFFTILATTHGCGVTNISTVYDAASGNEVVADISVNTNGDVTFTFSVAPTSNQFRIVIIG